MSLRPLFLLLTAVAVPITTRAALNQPWQQLDHSSLEQVWSNFASPPVEYSAQFTWGWRGLVDHESIVKDLDGIKALGVNAAIIEPQAGMAHPYLSPEYFELVRFAVAEAKKRGMRLWIMDDGDYPSGLAGGKFTQEKPELTMQMLGSMEKISLPIGTTLDRDLDKDVIAVVATHPTTGEHRTLDIASGHIHWVALGGEWDVEITHRIYRSLPTRSANNITGAKDYTHALMDFLDPKADDFFRKWTFDGYLPYIQDELGKTVLGFRGDEPSVIAKPYTPALFSEFEKRKGYDLRPYIAALQQASSRGSDLNAEQRRVYADYCDVWSDLFRDNYFNMEAAWCADHGVEMQLHIEHEEALPQLAVTNGDYFKCFRQIEIPGIDTIWHQIWMDSPADFPKLASSAAHLYGRPRVMCEAFAAYRPAPNLKQARWIVDFLLAHGVNRLEYMSWATSAKRAPLPANLPPPTIPQPIPGTPPKNPRDRYYFDPEFPKTAAYVNRLSYILGTGKPAAQIGLFVPSSSFWLGTSEEKKSIDEALIKISRQLVEHQNDFDYIDEQALSGVLALHGKELVNLSGQGYRAILVPPCLAISHDALNTLEAFAKAGGTVIFIGNTPGVAVQKNFLNSNQPADVSWASLRVPESEITDKVWRTLPATDFAVDQADAKLLLNHRHLPDGELYYIFNSGDSEADISARFAGEGSVELWDANTGERHALEAKTDGAGFTRAKLDIPGWASALVVLKTKP